MEELCPNIPKATKKSARETQNPPPEDLDVSESQEESVRTDQEPDAEISSHPALVPNAHPVHQVMPTMYMPYIEGPKWIGQLMMDYTTASSNGD